MGIEFWLALAAGALMGGFINGLAGFGTALLALGWWLQVMPPRQAVAIVLLMAVVSSVQGVWMVRRSIRWRRLVVFLVPGVLGIPIGLGVLEHVDARALTVVIAVFMLLYGGFFAFRKDLPSIERPTPVIDGSIGFAGGILGATAGLSGALPTMWVSMRRWKKEESRALLQPYNLSILGLSVVLLATDGAYDGETLGLCAAALVPTMIAAQIGLRAFKRLSDNGFRRLLIGMMLVSGLVLLGRVFLI